MLRVSVGWHFLYSGIWKLENPNFSSSGFLAQAKGPLAEEFYKLTPNYQGHDRLNAGQQKVLMEQYASGFEQHYKLSDEQEAVVERIVARRAELVETYLEERQVEIDTYLHELERLEETKAQASSATPFEQKRIWDKQQQLRGQLEGWLADVEAIHADFRADLEGVLNEEQLQRGDIPQPLLARYDIDDIVTYTNIAIGLCLMVGLFTRLASFGGAVFLAMIVLAQPDWPSLYPPPHPSAGRTLIVSKEFIEMMVLFFMATTRVGRWGGLDFFIHHLVTRPILGRKEAP